MTNIPLEDRILAILPDNKKPELSYTAGQIAHILKENRAEVRIALGKLAKQKRTLKIEKTTYLKQ